MPCLSGDYDPTVGILLQVAVLRGGTLESQIPGEAPVFAGLLDTGADVTCISDRVVSLLDLQPTGKRQVVGATGTGVTNQYFVDLLLQFGSQHLGIPNHEVMALGTGAPNFDVLVGRDIICRGVLTVDFAGRFTFSI